MAQVRFRFRTIITACLVLGTMGAAVYAQRDVDQQKLNIEPAVFQTWGYQPWWMSANWPSVDLALWNRIIFFELPIRPDGSVDMATQEGLPLARMASEAVQCGAGWDIAFTLFDPQLFNALFSSPVATRKLAETVLSVADHLQAQGVHLDIEIYSNVAPGAVEGYRQFVAQLAQAVRVKEPKRMLSVFGPAGGSVDLYDRSTLQAIDYIVLQGYDAHWVSGPAAGPVAPIAGNYPFTWHSTLARYLALGAKRSQLLFSVPYFGYEWPVVAPEPGSATIGKGQEMTYAPVSAQWLPDIRLSALEQAARYGVRRDPLSGSPYYVYQDQSKHWRQGWFDDSQSLTEKYAFVRDEKLAGIAAFPIGYDGGRLDPLLAKHFGKAVTCKAGQRLVTTAIPSGG